MFPYLNQLDITLTLNTDGVEIFETSNKSFWPVFLTINEIPYPERFSLKYMVMAGVFYGSKKFFSFQNILKIIFDKQLYIFRSEIRLIEYNVRIYIIGIVADKPARSSILCHGSHNCAFGCIYCLSESTSRICEDGRRHVYYPFSDCEDLMREDDVAPLVSAVSVETNDQVYGVNGSSYLFNFPEFRSISGSAFDMMHTLDLGVTKKLIEIVFSAGYSARQFSQNAKLDELNLAIKHIRPPQGIVNRIRPLSSINNWRAHEFKAFMTYYGPALIDIFAPTEISYLFKLLSEIYFKSNSEFIYDVDIHRLKWCISEFLDKFSAIFGEYMVTINFHELVHIPFCILNHGPLYNLSTYGYENFNRIVGNMIHGSQRVDKEIVKKFESLFKSLRGFVHEDDFDQASTLLVDTVKHVKVKFSLGDDLGVCGVPRKATQEHIFQFFPDVNADVFEFSRLKRKNNVICTMNYDENYSFCNSLVYNKSEDSCMEIENLFFHKYEDHFKIFAKGIRYTAQQKYSNVFSKIGTPISNSIVENVEEWELVCKLPDGLFSIPPNTKERL